MDILSVTDLCKRCLSGVSLAIQPGQIFGIIGMSGAGKSTLFRLLTGLDEPDVGTILANRKEMGMIFQQFHLFSSRNAWENVAYPLEINGVGLKERKKRSLAYLEKVGLLGKEGFYPAQLSGGEKQRVAIARALAGEPKVLLCDEATSSLDPTTTDAILELLRSLNEELGLTIVMITHEMEVIKRICSDVAVLDEGSIVEQGSVVDLFTSPKHPTTQRFLSNMTHEMPQELAQRGLLRLSFRGENAKEPIISRMVRQFSVDVNILLGGIDRLREGNVGNLVIELCGEQKEEAIAYLHTQGVGVEEVT